MFDTREHVAEQAITSRLESSLKMALFGYMYAIKFSNKIITDHVRYKGEQCCCYKIVRLKKWDNFII